MRWPQTEERHNLAVQSDRAYRLEGCVGLIDGMHVTLFKMPTREDASGFHNRNGSYSYNVLGVVNERQEFIYVQSKYAGSWDDWSVFSASDLARKRKQYFDEGR